MLGTPLRFNPFEPTLSLSFITHVNFTLNLVQEYLYPCPLDLVEHFAKFYDDVMKTKCGGGRIDLSIVGGEKENSILIAEKKRKKKKTKKETARKIFLNNGLSPLWNRRLL